MSTSRVLKWGLVVLKMGLSVALFVWLTHRYDVLGAVRETRGALPGWLWAAVALFFTSNLLGSWLWGRLLRLQGVEIPFARVAAYYFVGLFFNNFLPANIAGDFARISAARSHSDRAAPVFSATLMDRMMGGLAVAGLAMASVLIAWPWFHDLRVDALVTGLFAVSLVMYLAVFRRDALRVLEWPFRALRLPRLRRRMAQLMDQLNAYREQGPRLAALLVLGALIQVMRVCVHLFVARALGIRIPPGVIFTFVPILAAIVMLPISLNGIGVRESASVLLFSMVGLSGGRAIVFQDLTWLLAILVSLLGGVIFVLRTPLRWVVSWRKAAV
ncbi:MAG TPA: lysylphosphatidylglycerol synthase transmembrane domain-containing protein [Candidatus Saccharimonadales bacterium]|nr:lysylphosphatidylglycerol synthase transmembrane domain-containing protein [Candidatus Saccharimonadales bacterium]